MASKKFLVPINMSFLEIQNLRLHLLDAHPVSSSSAAEGILYYNTDTNKIVFHNHEAWVSLEDSGSISGVSSITASSPLARDVSTGAVTLSIAAASAETAGSMSTTHYSLLAGATNANTASTLVQRDSSGNFSAGTITANLTGSASQLNGQGASHYLDRGNHTGTQAANTISDLASVVKSYRLDEFAAPTSDVAFNNQKITGLGTPTNGTDAVTKTYVDSLSAGLDYKDSVRVATTVNVTLANEQTIDGVSVEEGDRVLVWQQSDEEDNGIYAVVDGGAWTRTPDSVTGTLTSGAWVYVEEGDTHGGKKFVLSTHDPITVGTTEQDWVVYGAGEIIVAGDGLNKAGDTLSVVGTNNRISVSSSGVDIHSSYVGQTSITTLGTITTGTWQGNTLGVGYGGTGIASYTTNNYIRASGATTLQQRTPAEVLSDIGAAASSHNHTLDSLSNVTITSNSSGELLKWNGSAWINNTLSEAGIAAASHAHAASDITSGTLAVAQGGTGIASYTTNNYIRASGATTLQQRTPAEVLSDIGAAASSHSHTLDSLSNVTITGNTDGELLRWSGAAWVNNTLAEAGILRKYAADLGNDVGENEDETMFTITHSLDTTDVVVSVWENASDSEVITDVKVIDADNIQVIFAEPPVLVDEYRVVVVG